jgi:hypothetical protein
LAAFARARFHNGRDFGARKGGFVAEMRRDAKDFACQ